MIPRSPDKAFFLDDPHRPAAASRSGEAWTHGDASVSFAPAKGALGVDVGASSTPVRWVVLRWEEPLPAGVRILGDHWERGYGDLEWRGIVPERAMPWYFLAHGAGRTAGRGVRTGAGSIAFWTADSRGFSLWLDLRSGTEGVRLNGRTLRAAEVVFFESEASPFAAAREFCRLLCPVPRLPAQPVYGGNDWYYAYGRSTQETMVRDSALLSELAGARENRPWSVVDSGWQFGGDGYGAPWHISNSRFPDMARMAREIAGTGCRPGLWMRPLLTHESLPAGWTFADRKDAFSGGRILDPSVPEVLDKVRADIRRSVEWGYGLIKHDFSTFEILGKWGFEMKSDITAGTWKFADGSRTTAEIVTALYRAIREGAGEALVLGCNTIGHLGAGLFEIQRTGDDTSGRDWERIRRMGINTLAFRMPQHETFFAADADCVGLTGAVPWEWNRQWLSLLAESGTALFVSAAPESVGPEQKAALRDAFAVASVPREGAEPLDWLENTAPERWRIDGKVWTFDWGWASPFVMG